MRYTADSIREMEATSIRRFVESCSEHFTGRVLDYGCGKQPYRDIVEAAGGDYHPFDRQDYPANVSGSDVGLINGINPLQLGQEWDCILCTQVVQYLPLVKLTQVLGWMRETLQAGKNPSRQASRTLVMTYPTNWSEVEEADLHRFTRAGMTRLLVDARFVIERHERRAEIVWQGETFATGYGVVARA